MEFEWDEAKSNHNLRRRNFGFDYAALVFAGPTIDKPDQRHAYGEVRILAIGAVGGEILAVVYTARDGIRRIISARKANRKERHQWQSFVNP